ncbi:NADH-quinone oxidoreductase subunit J, partial [Francisella tularensis subsp. holarctica]|nr:NADH-quinone oxidoreductase subunit J [Francisella tularensis subsp. holarctica]
VVFMLDLQVEEQGRVGRYFNAQASVVVSAIYSTVISYAATNVFAGAMIQGGVGGLNIIVKTMFSNANLYVFELVDFIL